MFTVSTQRNVARAKEYFEEHLSVNDYYNAQEIRPGQWIGIGAERLGLEQPVTRENFQSLCDNLHPKTGEQLTPRQNEAGNRRIFYDFVCSPPKSVSILAVCLNDERLIEAHEAAAQLAWKELESFAATRVRKQGRQEDRTTGNLVAAHFTHSTSRALDPQLHTHFTVFNATYDPTEKRWKALQAGLLYDATRYATEVYRNDLARRVQATGYRIEPGERVWEIQGVSKEIRERFSKRSVIRDDLVQATQVRLGRKLSKNEISNVVHWNRGAKIKEITQAEVRRRHQAELQGSELVALRNLQQLPEQRSVKSEVTESLAIEYALAHVFERRSVAHEHELLAAALNHRPGELELSRLKEALRISPGLISTAKGLTTREVLDGELNLIGAVENGKSAMAPLNPAYRSPDWLSADQKDALSEVLRSPDRITGFRGLAGTGKTTVLKELAPRCATDRAGA